MRSLRTFVDVETQVVSVALIASIAGADVGPGVVGAGGVPVTDPLVLTFVNVRTPEAVAAEADFTLALSPTLVVGAQGTGVATPVFFLAFINVLAVGPIADVSVEADAAVAAQSVVAAGLWVAAVQPA